MSWRGRQKVDRATRFQPADPRTRSGKRLSRRVLLIATVLAAVLAAVGGVVVGPKLLRYLPKQNQEAVVHDAAKIDQHDGSVVLVPKKPNGNLVLYVHGSNQTGQEILTDPNDGKLSAALLDAGYTVAATDAEGNGWGNAASVADYEAFIKDTRATYHVGSLYILAESMGGLTSLELIGKVDGVKAWAGLYPVCDASTVTGNSRIKSQLDSAYPGGPTYLQTLSPAPLPSGTPMLFWASLDDRTVPAATNSKACAAKVKAAGGSAEVITTTGDHGDSSNFDQSRLLAFYASH